ncbi:MAG: hypothetical protein ABIH48_00990 [Candidatus Falkowbacteria bacterium]
MRCVCQRKTKKQESNKTTSKFSFVFLFSCLNLFIDQKIARQQLRFAPQLGGQAFFTY